MPLQPQVLRIAMSSGVDTKTDQVHLPPGKLTVLENGSLRRGGQIQKRDGFARLPTALATGTGEGSTLAASLVQQLGGSASQTKLTSGSALMSFRTDVVVSDASRLYAGSSSGLVPAGKLAAIAVSSAPIVRNSHEQSSADLCAHPLGVTVAAWQDSAGGCRWSAVDRATGRALVADRAFPVTGTSRPKCLQMDTRVLVSYVDSGGNLAGFVVPALQPWQFGLPFDIATDLGTEAIYDATSGSNGNAYYAYKDESGLIRARYVERSLAPSVATTFGFGTGSTAVSVWADSLSHIHVAWNSGTDGTQGLWQAGSDSQLTSASLDAAFRVTADSGSIRLAGFPIGSQGHGIVYEVTGSDATRNQVRWATFTADSGSPASGTIARGLSLSGKPWFSSISGSTGDSLVFPAAYCSSLQPTLFVLDLGGTVLAKAAPGTFGGQLSSSMLPESNPLLGGASLAALVTDRYGSQDGIVLGQHGVAEVGFQFEQPVQGAEASSDLHIGGGFLHSYDGFAVRELGFHVWPEAVAAAPHGSGSIGAGQYEYLATYERTDGQGLVHQSGIDRAGPIVVASGSQANLVTVPTYRLGRADDVVSVVVWRTLANQAGPFYRLSSIASATLNDPSVDSVSFLDTLADADIDGNDVLYTDPNDPLSEVENIAPPAPAVLFNYQNRLCIVPAEAPLSVWFSKQVVQGVPVEFSDAFVLTCAQEGGDITAGFQMDANMVLFKQERIFVVTGQGPTANGQSNDFTPSQPVPSDIGCTNQKSIVMVPAGPGTGPGGLMFQSDKGVYLLGRDLGLRYVGAPVEEFISGRTVTSALLVPGKTECRFTLDDGTWLVYDYYYDQWGTFTLLPTADSVVYGGQHTYLTPSGLLFQQTPGQFRDDGNAIRLRVVTGWLSPAGLQGAHAFWSGLFYGSYRSPHSLVARVYFDGMADAIQQASADATALLGSPVFGQGNPWGVDTPFGGPDPRYQWRLKFSRKRGQMVKLELYDVPTAAGTGEGMALSALALELGVEQTTKRIGKARNMK